MCYAIPGKVKEIQGKTVLVDYFGEEKKAINEFYDIHPGDYICAQGGYVIKKVSANDAKSILLAWEELFFQLRDVDLRLSQFDFNGKNIDKRLRPILDKAEKGILFTPQELSYLINLEASTERDLLFQAANFLRLRWYKNSCCVHGIIEISNYCKCQCAYCGISTHNNKVRRYRMSPDEIVRTAQDAVEEHGFQALVLQSGEDPFYDADKLADIVRRIKQKLPVLICVSFGEVGIIGLKELYDAGARGILMRFETSNPKLYEKFHPGQTLETRLNHLKKAHDIGYLIMTGALIGLPGQTREDIINDIYLAKELHAEMYSFGPYLAHPDTPLAGYKPVRLEEVLKTLALIRLIDPENAKILVTTALETLSASARQKGLMSGANSLMLNITPIKYRKQYEIYPNRAYETEELGKQVQETISLLKALGRAPTDLGVSSS